MLRETGAVSIRDPQVITDLPLPDTSRAAVTISAELRNSGDQPRTGTLRGEFEGVAFEKTITLPPNSVQNVTVTPSEFPNSKSVSPVCGGRTATASPNCITSGCHLRMNPAWSPTPSRCGLAYAK